ncbi:anti-proliferative BTG domain-containing protein [Tieghemostelium lacteum]|uniref:Anti-proliferative BTG domain-containing protein n=1 Tax=Tieghemostelium lacteum TaxID=361077 RepID=A0A151Z8V8_TIELA|nr:anti-proliferative BTG domain-containing protein [Tieghemostelium lacteum]|eukprot:KYQ90389.1 anti-proliferative BTG domain-containing protein [Tieghemostelium lacteum]
MSPYAELNPDNEATEHQQPNHINTSTNSLPNTNNAISSNIEDIELYLSTYSSDFPELVVGACWWADSLSKLNQTIPKENIKRFRKELIIGLRDRIKGHWYPDAPERGQGYRAVVCEETTDRLLMDAAKKSDINGNFRSFFKQNTTMWIDPGNVTYRHGKHYEKTLYPFSAVNNNNIQSINSNPITSSSGSNSSSSSNILNNSFLMVMNQQSSSNTTPNAVNSTSPATNPTGTTITSSGKSSLLNSNSINYNPIYFNPNNPNNNTPPRTTTSSTTGKSSPQLSSSAPAFSPSSSVYHSLLSQPPLSQHTPPTSPLKDFQQKSIPSPIDSNNTNNIQLNNSNVYSNRPTTTSTSIKSSNFL